MLADQASIIANKPFIEWVRSTSTSSANDCTKPSHNANAFVFPPFIGE